MHTPNFVNPEKVALGTGNDLSNVTVTTRMGSVYRFPDMPEAELRAVLPESGRIPSDQPALMMMNASGALLTLPLRIVQEVQINGETVWQAFPV